MINVLFVCWGNICRSPMAEFMMKDRVRRLGIEEKFHIESRAMHTDEIWNGKGNPVYPPAKKKLAEHGISCEGKTAQLISRADYDTFDYLIGMDAGNMSDMRRAFGGDPQGKLSLMMDYTDRPGEVADPWYTRDFEATYRDLDEGIDGLLSYIEETEHESFFDRQM